jgi:hypothetical protein
MMNRAHVLVCVASRPVLAGCGEACDLKAAPADAAKRAVVDHFQQHLLAETRFEISPLLILAEQVKEFGDAGARF